MKHFIWILVLAGLLSSCGTENKTKDTNQTEVIPTIEAFEFQPSFTKLTWTAYKTTARVGVKGSFTEFSVEPGTDRGSLAEILNGLTFDIKTASSFSENEERDGKVLKHFYGSLLNTENITGEVTSINGNDSAGSARIAITMNNVVHEVDAPYTTTGNRVILNAKIELGDWKAEHAAGALNKICHDLHTGEDGVSKLWPDVDVVVESVLKKTVQNPES